MTNAAITSNASHLDVRADEVARARRKRYVLRYSAYSIVALAVLASIELILIKDTDWDRISGASILKTLSAFLAVDLSILPELIEPAIETVLMATLATMLGVILAVPVAWLGALNISPLGHSTYALGRVLMTLSRSVHEIVWALIFVACVGLGALAGILAMGVRSVGFISKTVAEAIEDVDQGPVEALRAAGANKFQIVIFAILPQVIPTFLGNIIFEWDVNIRRSTIMGLVGAGGLGLSLHRQMAAYNYGGITTVVLVILALIGIGEVISYYARRSVI